MDLRRGGWAQEVDAELRPGQGAVPQGLAGTLYRNGAGNHLSDYVIDGDGLVSAVTFTPGSPVHVRSRHVRTRSYRASLKAPGADAPPVRLAGANAAGGRLRTLLPRPAASQASTSVAMIDGRLLALGEGDMPWELEPGTLETLGRCDLDRAPAPSGLLGRRLGSPYSAQPCWDPRTAETGNFGCVYGPRPRDPWFPWHFAGAYDDGDDFTAVARYDTELGEADVHDYGPGHLVSEPLLVPRDRKQFDEQGWLVAYEARLTAGTTNSVVFDAQSVADGPVCTLPVPESLGFTFHGQWAHA
ncbi:carotenoid oxygenase family protein [Streptomyces anulatus]|uniref:carotenoid oxygenase family protein n=1 Tax=Streptomyces anulatus TaxID=1892 RepID=UPI0036310E5A